MDDLKNPVDTESLIDLVSKISKTVPDSEWARLPKDLSQNVDHYLYGTKKLSD